MLANVTNIINNFIGATEAAWPFATDALGAVDISTRNALLDDWLESMWEMIVEAGLYRAGIHVTLEVYGDGADCNDEGSRVCRPRDLPSHRIVCLPRIGTRVKDLLTGTEIEIPSHGIALDRFVSQTKTGWYDESPPLLFALTKSGNKSIMIKNEDVEFYISQLT